MAIMKSQLALMRSTFHFCITLQFTLSKDAHNYCPYINNTKYQGSLFVDGVDIVWDDDCRCAVTAVFIMCTN